MKAAPTRSALSALTLALLLTSCTIPSSPIGGSIESESERRTYGLKFDAGVGFYWAADGVTNFLYWTANPRARAEDSRVVEIPTDAAFYSYGLDFSQTSSMGEVLPPHVLGFGLSYRDVSGEYNGRWAVSFVPLREYSEPVYRIVPTGAGPLWRLRSGEVDYDFWALEVATPSGDDAYLFRFNQDDYEKQNAELTSALEAGLIASDRWHEGNASTFSSARPGQGTEFELRFTTFNPESGHLAAETRSEAEQIPRFLEGELLSPRRLVLWDRESGVEWDLTHRYEGLLRAHYQEGFDQVNINLRLQSPEGDDSGTSPGGE